MVGLRMSFYLSQVLVVFLLPAALFGLLWADVTEPRYKQPFWFTVVAIMAGSLLFSFLPFSQINIISVTSLYAATLILLLSDALFLRRHPIRLLLWQCLVFALSLISNL